MRRLMMIGWFWIMTCQLAVSAAPGDLRLPVFPRSEAPNRQLNRLDLLTATLEERFALTVLQGIVNRSRPSLYIDQDPGWHGTGSNELWRQEMLQRGYTFTDLNADQAIALFRSRIRGAVVYEPDLAAQPESLHKLNAITAYCALHDCLPVTETLRERWDLPIVLDVRGRYQTPEDAYGWAYRDLWPKMRRWVAHTAPTHMVLRDYLVQHRIMPVWISKGMNTRADGLVQRFIREAALNSPLMGCWGGYGEQPAGRYSEPDLQRLASGYGKFIVVSDGCFNLSVFSGLSYTRPARSVRPAPKLEADRVYVVFHITDGDNIQWLQQNFVSPQWWLDPARGRVPISWSLNPIATELIPMFVEYVQRNATTADEFTASTAGIGLVTPALYGAELSGIDRNRLYDNYLQVTDAAMRRVGQRIVHMGDTSLVPWTRSDFDRCARQMRSLKGILGDYGRVGTVFPDNACYTVARDVVVLRALGSIGPAKDDEDRARQIAESVRSLTPDTRPGFMHVCLVNWFVTPSSIARAMEILGEPYVAVLPSEAVDLYREAHGGNRGTGQ